MTKDLFRRRSSAACITMQAAFLVCALIFTTPASAYFFSKDLEAYGYSQVWFIPYESMPNMSGLTETDYLSGFSLAKVRGGVNAWFLDRKLGVFFQATFVKPVGILDASLIGKPIEQLGFQFGQFKIPSTFENLIDDRKLDFILRSKISTMLADYSLSRSPYADSKWYANNSYLRDLGVALKADAPIPYVPLKAFLMVGNGLGAGYTIAGDYQRGDFLTNGFGQFFYGARIELLPLDGNLIMGGVYNRNYHSKIVPNDGSKSTISISRESWEIDIQATVPKTGLSFAAIYGQGWLNDWEPQITVSKSNYSGWMAQAVWRIGDTVKNINKSVFLDDHGFDVMFRADQNRLHNYGSGTQSDIYYTVGFNYRFREYVKLQVEGIFKRVLGDRDLKTPDFDSDGALICVQGAI